MTAEIAVLNNSGVALAADSAVTIGTRRGPKIFNSVNKLFALSKYAPVGVMVYGGAEFMTVPWEIIIKEYRRRLARERFPTLEAYAEGVLNFLRDKSNPLFPATVQDWYLRDLVGALFSDVNREILDRLKSKLRTQAVDEKDISSLATEVINDYEVTLKAQPDIESITPGIARNMLKARPELVREVSDEVFERLPLTRSGRQGLSRLAALVIQKAGGISSTSGLVVAGYGEEEYFPSLLAYETDAAVDGYLRYHEKDRRVIGPGHNAASVVPFAQEEMVHTFMRGIDPAYGEVIEGFIGGLMKKMPETLLDLRACKDLTASQREAVVTEWETASKRLAEDFDRGLQRFAREEFVGPVVEMVAALPKDELAAMAEAFVNLHILKRRVTPEFETVGGPIDVAVISKGDGFVWIRRKHYFEGHLNPQFFANYYEND